MSELEDNGLSIEEAAEKLGVSSDEVKRLIEAGLLETTTPDSLRIDALSVFNHITRQLSAISSDLLNYEQKITWRSILGSMLIPLLLLLFLISWIVEMISLKNGEPLIPLWAFLLLVGFILSIARWFAQRQPDFESTNGMGVTLYGDKITDEGRVGTTWLICCGIPLLPVYSYLLIERGQESETPLGRTKKHILQKRHALYGPQIFPLMGAVWCIIGLVSWGVVSLI